MKMSGTHLPELRKVKLVHKVAHCWRFDLLLNDYGTEEREGQSIVVWDRSVTERQHDFKKRNINIIGYKVIACSTKGHLPLCSEPTSQCYNVLLGASSLLLWQSKEHIMSGQWSRVSLGAFPSFNCMLFNTNCCQLLLSQISSASMSPHISLLFLSQCNLDYNTYLLHPWWKIE